jgi:hypothetical protein
MYFGNVTTLVIGGRPAAAPMNLVGGVQGAEAIEAFTITAASTAALLMIEGGLTTLDSSDQQTLLNIARVPPISQNNWQIGYNLLDNLLPDSDVPMQFNNQAAGCRLFYLQDDMTNIGSTWNRIAAGNYSCVDSGKKPSDQTPVSPSGSGGSGSSKKSAGVKPTASLIGLIAALAITILVL